MTTPFTPPSINLAAWDALEARFFDPARVAALTAKNAGRLRALSVMHAEPTITLGAIEQELPDGFFIGPDDGEDFDALLSEQSSLQVYLDDGPAARGRRLTLAR